MTISRRAILLTGVLALALFAPAVSAQSVGDPCQIKHTPLCVLLMQSWGNIGALWTPGNGNQLAKGFTDGGTLHPGHGGGYQGQMAIGEFFNGYLLPKFSVAHFESVEAGYVDNTPGQETVWERGQYAFTGAEKNVTGNFFALWKTMDGSSTLQIHVLMTHDGAIPTLPGRREGVVAKQPSGATAANMRNVTATFEKLFFLRAEPTQDNFGAVYLPNTLIMASEHSYVDFAGIKGFYGGLIQSGVSAISIVLTEYYTGPKTTYFAATGTFRMIGGDQGAIEGPTLKSGSIMLIGYTDNATGQPAWVRQFTLTNKA